MLIHISLVHVLSFTCCLVFVVIVPSKYHPSQCKSAASTPAAAPTPTPAPLPVAVPASAEKAAATTASVPVSPPQPPPPPVVEEEDPSMYDPVLPTDPLIARQTELEGKCAAIVVQVAGLPAFLSWLQRRDAAQGALTPLLRGTDYCAIAANGVTLAAIEQEAAKLVLSQADCATLVQRHGQAVAEAVELCKELRAAKQFPALIALGTKLEELKAMDLSGIPVDLGEWLLFHNFLLSVLVSDICTAGCRCRAHICDFSERLCTHSPTSGAPAGQAEDSHRPSTVCSHHAGLDPAPRPGQGVSARCGRGGRPGLRADRQVEPGAGRRGAGGWGAAAVRGGLQDPGNQARGGGGGDGEHVRGAGAGARLRGAAAAGGEAGSTAWCGDCTITRQMLKMVRARGSTGMVMWTQKDMRTNGGAAVL